MAKRKKKDRFYVERLIEFPECRSWHYVDRNGLVGHERKVVQNIINAMKANKNINAVQRVSESSPLCKISFVVYRNWP